MRSPGHTRFGSKPLHLVHSAGAASAPARASMPAPPVVGAGAAAWLDQIDWAEVAFWAAVAGAGYYAYHHLSEKKHRHRHAA